MVKFVKVILFLLFSVVFCGTANSLFAAKVEQDTHAVTVVDAEQGSLISSSQLPYLPEAELVGSRSLMHQVTMSRVQRVNVIEYSLSLKGVLQSLANREASLSQHWRRIYNTTTSYNCHPSSQYYVFALRRIII